MAVTRKLCNTQRAIGNLHASKTRRNVCIVFKKCQSGTASQAGSEKDWGKVVAAPARWPKLYNKILRVKRNITYISISIKLREYHGVP